MRQDRPDFMRAGLLATASLFAIGTLAPTGAQAQPADPTAVEEVIVTATRRAEPLQHVPIAVSVIGGDLLRATNLNNLRDIATEVPALNFRTAASNKDQALFLRGLGTVSTSPGVEPSVSTMLDGIVLARQGQATLDLLDVDRIEVLRGPQGTLFGKNASAGVLNIVSKKPSFDTAGYIDVSGFTPGEGRIRAGISTTVLPEKIAANVSFLGSTWRGNVKNVVNGKWINGAEKLGVRSRILFTPSDNIELVVSGDYISSKDTTPQGVVTRTSLIAFPTNVVSTFPAFAAAVSPIVPTDTNRQINSNYNTNAKDHNYGLSAELGINFGDYRLTSITGWRGWRNKQLQDQDRLPLPLAAFPQQHDVGRLSFSQYSQEVRLASPQGDRLNYVVGLFYFEGRDRETYARETTTVAGATQTLFRGVANYGVVNKNFAVFGEANYRISESIRAIGGVRWVRDDLSFDFNRVSTSPVAVAGIQTAFTSAGRTRSEDVAGRAGFQVDISSAVMAYATYSRGYKGPAYNPAFSMLPQDTIALAPETSNSFELGLKSKVLDDRLLLNAAVFLQKLENYQVPFFDSFNGSPITRLINAGKVSTRGAEFDLKARVTETLSLSGALTYTNARIDQFTCPAGTSASCVVNGYTLPYAPRWRATVRAVWTSPVTDSLDLIIGTDVNWRTKTQYSINQTVDTIENGYAIWNAAIGIATHDGLKATVLVKNIADRAYSPFLARFVPRDDSRYFGISVLKDF